MNPADVPRLLAMAAARDNRKRNDAMAIAWFQDLGDLAFDAAVEAMNQHYRTSDEYLMPVHIRRIAEELDRERRREARLQREAITADRERRALDSRPIADRSAELQALIRETSEKLSTPEAKLERAKLVARGMKGRPETPPRAKDRSRSRKKLEYAPPKDEAVAALARQYLADGHSPDDLSERLAVSRKWLRKAAADGASLPPPTPLPEAHMATARNPQEALA